MIYTLFANPEVSVTAQGAYPGEFADLLAAFPLFEEIRHNVLYFRHSRYELDNAATAQLKVENFTSSDWQIYICRVIGTAKILVTGVDWDGVSALSGVIPAYGTDLFPGFAICSPASATAITIQATADDTVIDALSLIVAADNDARLDENA